MRPSGLPPPRCCPRLGLGLKLELAPCASLRPWRCWRRCWRARSCKCQRSNGALILATVRGQHPRWRLALGCPGGRWRSQCGCGCGCGRGSGALVLALISRGLLQVARALKLLHKLGTQVASRLPRVVPRRVALPFDLVLADALLHTHGRLNIGCCASVLSHLACRRTARTVRAPRAERVLRCGGMAARGCSEPPPATRNGGIALVLAAFCSPVRGGDDGAVGGNTRPRFSCIGL